MHLSIAHDQILQCYHRAVETGVFEEAAYIRKLIFGNKTTTYGVSDISDSFSQQRAMEAGFDNYGLGVLLGLSPAFLAEIAALQVHSQELHVIF